MLDICDYFFLHLAYGDDIIFSIKQDKSVMEFLHAKDSFSNYSELYSNISKCKTAAGIVALKEVHVERCGLRSVDLTSVTLKM